MVTQEVRFAGNARRAVSSRAAARFRSQLVAPPASYALQAFA